ncbi:sensor histidine kinase [Aurantiacibacter xanthus]|uniref:histidine kinase n=1 Tax=Aurantiacibacter xanthus TaxID=1784712 RepID=A0A3A1P739_9SPHN|nr:HAMP domain-containing sensor histidine kinase [Aurantiacibacter xanthus]RIV89487.1 sensor histidine kinase [Aurantiacibacter xanthus]
MPGSSTLRTHARTDGADRLIAADEPLAGLHLRCGGEVPGAIVAPALREVVQMAREYGLKLARRLRMADDREVFSMWVEVEPEGEGCRVAISNWRSEGRPPANVSDDEHRIAMARHMAALSARLGPRQELLAIDSHGAELAPLAQQMTSGAGRPWTDFVSLEGNVHQQPLHWRLLDGARLRVAGLPQLWTAHLVPLGGGEPGSGGFELLLVSDAPAPAVAQPAPAPAAPRHNGIDRKIAPVLRQPVSRIIANAETIRSQLSGPLADEYTNYAADITAAGEHLLALIEDLTTLELIEDDSFSPAPDQIDLADVARRAAGILGMRARDRQISVDVPKAGESAPAIGEFRRVLQIVLNLLGNAIRYSPEGSSIWLRAESEGGIASLTVADQGEGLNAEEILRVFTKFERLGRSGDGGSGLGLYISRRLAEAMGGTLTVESAKGQGARFTLSLPADQAATS